MVSSEFLAATAGAALSLLFSYIPGVKDWFDALDPTRKRLVMAVMLLAVSAVAFALSCWNVTPLVVCDKPGLVGLVTAFLAALVANQATYQISPRLGEGSREGQ